MIFERLWRELGIDRVINEVAKGRNYGFPLERAICLTVLHRLCVSGSDRAGNPICSEIRPGNTTEVMVDDHRYVVCLNADEAEKDRHDLEAILASSRDPWPRVINR